MVSNASLEANDFDTLFCSVASQQGPCPPKPQTLPMSRQSPAASMALSPKNSSSILFKSYLTKIKLPQFNFNIASKEMIICLTS